MNFINLFLVSSILLFGSCSAQWHGYDEDYQSWLELKDSIQVDDGKLGPIRNALHDIFKRLKSSSFPTAVGNITNQQCIDDSVAYAHGFYTGKIWAWQMHESSGSLPLGLFGAGNYHADGLFDECLAITPENQTFTGQYCTVYFKAAPVDPEEIIFEPPLGRSQANLITLLELLGLVSSNSQIRVDPKLDGAQSADYLYPSIALCLPSSCSANDLGQSIGQLIGEYVIANRSSIVTVADDRYCFTANPDPPSYDGPDITVIVVFSLLGLLVVAATGLESWRLYKDIPFSPEKDGLALTSLHCFSILNNGRKLLSMKVTSSSDNLGCVHGIRVLSTCWVVIGHTWIMMALSNRMNPNMVKEDGMSWWFQGIGNATISVDSFLLIGGLLVSYLMLRELDNRKGDPKVFLFALLHRFLRLTPVYALVLGFVATLIVYVGTGPYWFRVTYMAFGCRMTWWRHFLYINNLFPIGDLQCLEQTWYLALDMQLFIIAPIFIYTLWRWKKMGITLVIAFTLASIGANIAIFAVFPLLPTSIFTRTLDLAAQGTSTDYYYSKLWTRAPPYMVGILLGWYLYRLKGSEKPIQKWILVLGWIISVSMGLAVVYGLVPYVDPAKAPEVGKGVTIAYGSLHRTAWALAVGWIIFVCVRGFVNRFLSWKGFMPLSRMTYCVYLVHLDYLNVFYARLRKFVYYTFFDHLTTYFGILLTVFGLAFIVSVTIEASLLNLEKLLLTPSKKKNTE